MDLRDGTVLIKLLELLTGKELVNLRDFKRVKCQIFLYKQKISEKRSWSNESSPFRQCQYGIIDST